MRMPAAPGQPPTWKDHQRGMLWVAQSPPPLLSTRKAYGPRLILSMHELSLSMPEPMLSLSMLTLTTSPVVASDVIVRRQYQN